MNVYIWKRIEKLTDNYHSGGGLVVIADTLEHAMDMARIEGVEFNASAKTFDDGVLGVCDEGVPTRVETLAETSVKEQVFLFRDAGCC